MDYLGIIKKTFWITWKDKYLWPLGMIAALSGGTSFSFLFNLSFNLSDFYQQDNQNLTPPSLDSTTSPLRILGAETNVFSVWLSSHPFLVVFLGILFLLFLLFILVISLIAKAGLVATVFTIIKEEALSFKEGLFKGRQYFLRFLGLSILIGLLVLTLFFVLGLPLVNLVLAKSYLLAFLLACLALPIFILGWIYLTLIGRYAERLIVGENMDILESTKNAYRLILQFKKEIFFFWLISVGLNLGINFVLTLIFLPVLILGGLYTAAFGTLFYKIFSLTPFLVFAAILFTLFLLIWWVVAGIINVLFSSYWTISYLSLTNLKK